MNADARTASGTAAIPQGRIASAIGDSVIAAVVGYAVSVFSMCVGELCFIGVHGASGIPHRQAIGNLIGIAALEAMWNAMGSVAGWLVFLFPAAMLHGRRPIVDRMIPMCLAAALVGALLTGLEMMPFSAWPYQLFSWMFVPFGAIDAVVAAAILILLRRKSSRLTNEGH